MYFDFFCLTRRYGLMAPIRGDLADTKICVEKVCSDEDFAPVYRFQLREVL